jgi:hypothetical protein
VTKLGAKLAVCASARQELQVRPTLFEIWLNNLLINFTSLLCNDHHGSRANVRIHLLPRLRTRGIIPPILHTPTFCF